MIHRCCLLVDTADEKYRKGDRSSKIIACMHGSETVTAGQARSAGTIVKATEASAFIDSALWVCNCRTVSCPGGRVTLQCPTGWCMGDSG